MWYGFLLSFLLLIYFLLFLFSFKNNKDLVVVEINAKTTNSNHNVMLAVNFHMVLAMILVVNHCFFSKVFFFVQFNSNICIGACCDNGGCQLTLDTSCNGGIFQGVTSDCSGDTCPIGNVCCQDDVEQPCLTGENDVEQCTAVGQFAADDCGECLRRLSDFALSILSSSEFISLSGKKKTISI